MLAVAPRVVCLDEPTAGVAQREAEAFGPLIKRIQHELDATLIVVEHDLPLIMSISDRIYCLEAGAVIAHGRPDDVRNDPLVVASYLGTDDRAIQRSNATPTPQPSRHSAAFTIMRGVSNLAERMPLHHHVELGVVRVHSPARARPDQLPHDLVLRGLLGGLCLEHPSPYVLHLRCGQQSMHIRQGCDLRTDQVRRLETPRGDDLLPPHDRRTHPEGSK